MENKEMASRALSQQLRERYNLHYKYHERLWPLILTWDDLKERKKSYHSIQENPKNTMSCENPNTRNKSEIERKKLRDVRGACCHSQKRKKTVVLCEVSGILGCQVSKVW